MSADQYSTKKPVFEPTIEEIAVAAVKDAYVAHGYRACLEILERALNRIHVFETARKSTDQEIRACAQCTEEIPASIKWDSDVCHSCQVSNAKNRRV